MKKIATLIVAGLLGAIVVASVYADNFSVLQKNAFSDQGDTGTLAAYKQYGERLDREVKNNNETTFKVEDIVRDGLQTKISFVLSNLKLENDKGFSTRFKIVDNLGNVYDKCYTTYKHDKEKQTVSGIVEFEPIIDKSINSFELYVTDEASKNEWSVEFNVDSQKVGSDAKTYKLNKIFKHVDEEIEIVEVVSTPSRSKLYLNTEIGIYWCQVIDTKGNIVAEMLQGFKPFEKNDQWTNEFTFTPIPTGIDLILEIHTKTGETIEVPFKL